MAPSHHIKAWFVTTPEVYQHLVANVYIRPTNLFTRPPELPVIWFSLDQYVDRSARKVFTDGITYRVLSVQETRAIGGGLMRLGIDARKLLRGNSLRKRAHITWQRWFAIRQARITLQADPELWLGSLKPIAIADMTIDVMNEHGAWIRVQDGIL